MELLVMVIDEFESHFLHLLQVMDVILAKDSADYSAAAMS